MKKILFSALAIFLYQSAQSQNNVGINTATPDASAALDINSTTQGMLIPRMTMAQRDAINMVGGISTPASGLLIYQTDNTPGFYFYNGTEWASLNGSSGQGFANGTTGGQVYLTGPALPYAPQNPATVTGDVTINSAAATTIVDNAVTTTKINDAAVTSEKLASASVTTEKISATGTADGTTFLRGDGSWAVPAGTSTDSSIYAAKKTAGISLLSLGLFPSGFRAVNFLNAERTLGNAALFSDTDNTYIIPSNGVYAIGYSFRYGTGLQSSILANSPGLGIVRTRAGVATTIDSRSFSGANLILLSLTISEESLNSLYSLQAGDKISFGLVGSSALNVGLLGSSTANFFVYKVSN
jgi:hypothetical protein